MRFRTPQGMRCKAAAERTEGLRLCSGPSEQMPESERVGVKSKIDRVGSCLWDLCQSESCSVSLNPQQQCYDFRRSGNDHVP